MATKNFLNRHTPPHLVTLVALSAMGALNLNIFLPSLPNMAVFFGVEYSRMQLAISAYLAGTAIVQIFIGPLSDRFGRRPVMLGSLGVFLAATIVAYFAENYWLFMAARMVQISVSGGLSISRAIVRDMFDMDRAASMIGYVTMGMALVPMIGPLIGGLLDEWYGWQSSVAVLIGAGVLVLMLAWADLGETNTRRTASMGKQFRELPELIQSRRFWGFAFSAMFAAGSFFSYLGGAPIVATRVLHLSPSEQGYYFGVLALGYMLGNFLAGRYSARFGVNFMMLVGGIVVTVGVSASLIFVLLGYLSPVTTFGPLALLGVGNGIGLPSANAGMVSVRPHLAGSASGFGGAMMIGGGAMLATLTGYLLDIWLSPVPLLVVMLISAILSILTTFYVIHVARQVARQAVAGA